MFCWTELGAKHVGIIQSLIATCRLHGIDPYTLSSRCPPARQPAPCRQCRWPHPKAVEEELRWQSAALRSICDQGL